MRAAGEEFSEAVLFIDGGRISREMLYTEFEAVLNGVVPIPDLADQTARGAYIRVDRGLYIRAAVFFLIDFDAQGNADGRWNVPLEQLADNAGRGPDLGAGPIRLACRSQCSIAWHQQNLWDPDMAPGSNSFSALKKSIAANRLKLKHVKAPAEQKDKTSQANRARVKQIEARVRRQVEQEFRDHMASQLKEQRLRISMLTSKHQQEVRHLKREHQQRLQEYRHQLEKRQHELELQRQQNRKLKEAVRDQASKMEGLREYFESKLKSAQTDESSQLRAVKENFEAELESKLAAATVEVKEKLQLREVELMYRKEQGASLEKEVERLRAENRELLNNSGGQLLEKLDRAGLSFVAYHPGAGHLTIPLADMATYVDNPIAYAADQCGVSLEQYRQWLDHRDDPRCRARLADGEYCGAAVDPVADPGDFHSGESDRCRDHRTRGPHLAGGSRVLL